MPARTGLGHYEDALADAGIPYRHEGSRDFYQRQEVRDLIWVLAAIDDPTDRLALVGALRSSAFAIDDESLVRHRAEAGSLSYRSTTAGPDRGGQRRARRAEQPAPDAHAVLARRDRPPRRRAHPPGRVRADPPRRRPGRREPARDRRPGPAVRRRRRGRAAAVHPPPARLDGRGADRDRGDRRRGDRRRRADHDDPRRQGPRVPDRRAREPRLRATRTTPSRCRASRSAFLHFRVGAGSAGRHGHFKTPGYDDAWEQEKQHVEAERLRLLYVAATRAREHLIVPCVTGILAASGLLGVARPQPARGPQASSTRSGSTSSSCSRSRSSSRSRSPMRTSIAGSPSARPGWPTLEALKRLAAQAARDRDRLEPRARARAARRRGRDVRRRARDRPGTADPDRRRRPHGDGARQPPRRARPRADRRRRLQRGRRSPTTCPT